MGEVLRAEIAGCARDRERFGRHRLDDLELAQAYENLEQADSGAIDQQWIADGLLQRESLFHQRARFRIPRIEASPAQLDQRAGDILGLPSRAPKCDGFLDQRSRAREVAAPRGELSRSGERPRAIVVYSR